jgi:hypothetical protein
MAMQVREKVRKRSSGVTLQSGRPKPQDHSMQLISSCDGFRESLLASCVAVDMTWGRVERNDRLFPKGNSASTQPSPDS